MISDVLTVSGLKCTSKY